MRFKVELGFIDEEDESRDVFYETYVDAEDESAAVDAAKQKQQVETPDLKVADRWFWCAFATNEQSQ